MLHPDKKHYSKVIQKPIKGFQIEYFINMVVVFETCAHTHSHTQNDLPGIKGKDCMPKGEMKNKKKFLSFFIIVGNYVHITYKAIARSVQGSKGWGERWEKKNLGKNSTVA